jgi:hypothetical protein
MVTRRALSHHGGHRSVPRLGKNRRGKRPERALKSGIDRICSFPGSRQQFVEPVDGMSVDHACAEPGARRIDEHREPPCAPDAGRRSYQSLHQQNDITPEQFESYRVLLGLRPQPVQSRKDTSISFRVVLRLWRDCYSVDQSR